MTKKYLWVFGWLIVFTVLELYAAQAGFERPLMITLLLATAVGKAMLIALYFMHLKSEGILVWLLPLIPLFFAVFLVCGLFPDIAWKLTWKA